MKQPVIYSALTAAIFSLSLPAFSSTYQTELEATYWEPDIDPQVDATEFQLKATRYFSPVDTTNLPFAEAAFLRKTSYFSLGFTESDYKVSSDYFDGDSKQNTKQREADINYFVPDSKFFVGAGIHQYKINYSYYYDVADYGNYEFKNESDWDSRWVARLGIAPVDGLLVWSEFFEDIKISEHWNLHAKYVKPLANNKAIGVESTFEKYRSDTWIANVAVDYYFTQALSIGAGVSHYESDWDDSTGALVRSRYFLTERVSLDLSYVDSDFSESWKVGGNIRF